MPPAAGPRAIRPSRTTPCATGGLHEPELLPANVTASDFGPLFATTVTGQIYAQPLVVKQSVSSTGTLIVATEQDNVYGMNPVSGAIDWTKSLGEETVVVDRPGLR